MMNCLRALITTTIFLFGGIATAEPDGIPNTSFLGNWSSPCDAWGVPAICTSTWSRGKHNTHIVQEYSIVREADGGQIFAGRGVYQFDGSAVRGAWEGSNGAIHPIVGKYGENSLSVIWGSPETEIGRSEYVINNGKLIVRDLVLTEKEWRVFMTITYERDE